MKSIFFSDEERNQTVRNLIVARYNHQAKISNYTRLVPYLNEGRIEILCDLKKSVKNRVFDSRGHLTTVKDFFDASDAETYFEWLVSVVTHSKEDVSEDIVKKANNQLFRFIDVLGDDLHMEKNVQLLAPYDWQKLFMSFKKQLTEMQNIIDKGDKEIIEVLKQLLNFMKKNTKLLDSLQRENERVFGQDNPS